jgi:glycosyltransferase involved in cell wall biosynthesis
MRLTVGVIARNGMPHLRHCLSALPALADCAAEVEFILVDSASSDGTLDAMLAFARGRSGTRVYAMQGEVNAAAARNVILRRAEPGAVFLVDGDVAVSREFVVAALEELAEGSCEVVYGRLPEILYDGNHRPVGRTADAYAIRRRGYERLIRGIVMLGPQVLEAGVTYDEAQRRSHDLELGVRLARRFRILALPIVMGTHHSVSYYAPSRVGHFYGQAYLRPMGRLLRKHRLRPGLLRSLGRVLSGFALGLCLQLFLVAAILLRSSWMAALAAGLIGLDLARFAWQGRLREYIPHRIVAPWQIVYGFLLPENESPRYHVELRYPYN